MSSAGKGRKSWDPPHGTVGSEIAFWNDKEKFGRGTHGLLVNNQVFDPAFFNGHFTWNDIGWFLTATFVAVKWNDFRILLTEDFFIVGLADRGNGSSGSFKRTKAKFIEAGLMRRVKYGGKAGNEYLLADVMTIPHQAKEMNHYREAHMLTVNARDKARREQLEAETELRRREAEKKKRQLEWAAACREAKKLGLPPPEAAEFLARGEAASAP